ncbi:hypothetical protein KSS87_022153 [Heliosperma pusillum]|nr:hypothetical protein KSS87_004639 [Heliosperma pusillum]KAH9621827.1 hypothetical protein KSS87_022153 [Heliosperma pusillum]
MQVNILWAVLLVGVFFQELFCLGEELDNDIVGKSSSTGRAIRRLGWSMLLGCFLFLILVTLYFMYKTYYQRDPDTLLPTVQPSLPLATISLPPTYVQRKLSEEIPRTSLEAFTLLIGKSRPSSVR